MLLYGLMSYEEAASIFGKCVENAIIENRIILEKSLSLCDDDTRW